MKKEVMNYVAPCIEVIEMEVETVLAASGTNPGDGGGVDLRSFGSNRSAGGGNSYATSSEIEDMLNDILTIEK